MSAKIDIINDAYSQLRISGLTVSPTPEDLEIALMRLENMMAELFNRNIGIGYNFEDEPEPNTEHTVDRAYWQMMATNLAVRLIPDFNKPVPQALLSAATASLSSASGASARNLVKQVPYPVRQPRGSGNTLRYNRWQRFYQGSGEAPSKTTTNVIYAGDVNDYAESFADYLLDTETISAYEISADKKLNIVSDAQNAEVINYRIEALDNENIQAYQQVKIVVTTSSGRKTTRLIDFEVVPSERVGQNA